MDAFVFPEGATGSKHYAIRSARTAAKASLPLEGRSTEATTAAIWGDYRLLLRWQSSVDTVVGDPISFTGELAEWRTPDLSVRCPGVLLQHLLRTVLHEIIVTGAIKRDGKNAPSLHCLSSPF